MVKLTPDNWQILIGVISLIITLIGLVTAYSDSHKDFVTSLDPISVEVNQGNTTQILAHFYPDYFYDDSITLRAESVPPNIQVDFNPQNLKHESDSVSTITILAEKEASPRIYWIPVVSEGSDGKQHVCNFMLKVIGKTEKPTPSPIQISTENKTPVSTANYTPTVGSTPIETTPLIPNEDNIGYTDTTNPQSAKYTPINISEYTNWSFTTTKSSFYTYVPKGYSYVTLTVNVENNGFKPISSSPSYWKFNYNNVSYSYDLLSAFSHCILSWDFVNTDVFDMLKHPDIKPGEKSTFVLYYIVKGEAKFGSITYVDPYVQI